MRPLRRTGPDRGGRRRGIDRGAEHAAGSYLLILPLMAACFAAVFVADLCRSLPINEALLEDDLNRPGNAPVASYSGRR